MTRLELAASYVTGRRSNRSELHPRADDVLYREIPCCQHGFVQNGKLITRYSASLERGMVDTALVAGNEARLTAERGLNMHRPTP